MGARGVSRTRFCLVPLGACLSLLGACGGGHALRGGTADAMNAGVPDADVERAPEAPEVPVGPGVDARDAVATADVAIDATPETRDAAADAQPDLRPDAPPACPVDCNHLPHVRAGTAVACIGGACVLPVGSCESGFAHCSANPSDGCEADLTSATSCGGCNSPCYQPYPTCVVQTGYTHCGPACAPPTPDNCYYGCYDFQNDPNNCGSCGLSCYLPNAVSGCSQGTCTFVRCMDPGWADCTPDPGCETQLGSDGACAACGDKACTLANTLFTCASADGCATAVCAAGFGNCDGATPDCETAFAAGGSCLPGYLGTTPLATQVLNDAAVAIGTDGSYLVGGEFSGTVDFDPSSGQDIRTTLTPSDVDGFITKINPDGSYGWTRTFAGRGNMTLHALAAAAGGAMVAVGSYSDSVDLDPGTGVDLHQTATAFQQDALVVKLAGDGSFVWGRTFAGTDSSAFADMNAVAVDATDAVYAAGLYQSTVDFDPGPATALHTAALEWGVLVKLTAAGGFSWVQSFDNGTCQSSLTSVAAATDGAVWSVGSIGTGPGCTLASVMDVYSSQALIATNGPAGEARGMWTLGTGTLQVDAESIVAGPSGSVYVGGATSGLVDFDPGTSVAARWVGGWPGGFILKLGAGASFLWAEPIADMPMLGLAGTADGGVLGVGMSNGAIVTRLHSDGTPAWTFTSGSTATSARRVAARGTTFAVAGFSSGSGDFDPGAGIDIVFGDIVFLSRFAF